jgi:hypothetical protein
MILFIVLILGLFIIFNINLFVLNNTNTICTLSPRLLNPIIKDPNSENIQENLEYLQEKLVAERKDYNIQKKAFDVNVDKVSDYFNSAIDYVEFSRSDVIAYLKPSDKSTSLNT